MLLQENIRLTTKNNINPKLVLLKYIYIRVSGYFFGFYQNADYRVDNI